jgi:pyruvate formate lyase activating enzyme
MQPEFAEGVLRGLRAAGIHTALDTCGLCPPATLERLLPHTDLVLFDLKLLDSNIHQRWTGAPNSRILDSLSIVAEFRGGRSRPLDLWIRTPLIPGATDGEENLRAIGQYLAAHLQGRVARWELCAFNNLCRDQYRRLGQDWAFSDAPLMSAEQLQACERLARASGLRAEIVATGAVRFTECAVE